MAAKPMKKMTDAEKSKLKKDLKPLKNDKTMLKPLKNDKPARGAKAGTSLVSKAVGRAKTVGREVRDIKTAAGTVAKVLTTTKKNPAYVKQSVRNLKEQIGEVGKAAKSGKKGTESDQFVKLAKNATGMFGGRDRSNPRDKNKSVTKDIKSAKKLYGSK